MVTAERSEPCVWRYASAVSKPHWAVKEPLQMGFVFVNMCVCVCVHKRWTMLVLYNEHVCVNTSWFHFLAGWSMFLWVCVIVAFLCIHRLIHGEFIQTLGVWMHSYIPDNFLTHGQPSSTQTGNFSELSWNEAEFLFFEVTEAAFCHTKHQNWAWWIEKEKDGKTELFYMEL